MLYIKFNSYITLTKPDIFSISSLFKEYKSDVNDELWEDKNTDGTNSWSTRIITAIRTASHSTILNEIYYSDKNK